MNKEFHELDGIIFDVDGTLWDATEEAAACWSNIINQKYHLDLQISSGDLKRVFGKPMDEIFVNLFPMLSKEECLTIGNACFKEEINWLREHPVPLFENISSAMNKISSYIPVYIVSNCQKGYIEVMMETNKLTDCISGHLCFGDTGLQKWETIQTLMQTNHLKSVVYVGDTQSDYETCKRINIPFIHVNWGYGNVPNAKYQINHIEQLYDILGLE